MSRRLPSLALTRAQRTRVIGVAGVIAGMLALLGWALSTELAKPAVAAPRLVNRDSATQHSAQTVVALDAVVGEACEHPARFGPDGAADELAQHLARHEWPAAAAVIAAFPDAEDRLTAWPLLLEAWAESEPAAALQFTETHLVAAERRAALAAVVQGWTERDLPAAMTWLGAQSPRAENDAAFAALAENTAVVATQPRLALEWAANVTDARLRWETTRAVVQRWAQRDEFAARDYASRTADLTPERRAQLLQRVAQRTALLD